MKRSRFNSLPREIALERAANREVKRIQREGIKTSPTSDKRLKQRSKSLSKAAKSGKKRSNFKRAGKDALEKQFKKVCRERDDYTCQWPECSYRHKYIPVHHINERSQRPDERYNPDNGACICWQHHDYAHHDVEGRRLAKEYKLLGGVTYELACKGENNDAV